ncbi:outer membrane protein assembly factor BamB family protein [Rubinisphaera margarita]|uniref:outer membrane protein assembly factor BamB family protein n=1 Tax=Rubinisphaera margarita TaxID=2909586 RepID=UPI001EE848E7|nr:PQQ-binding-like beta-propeller repeat protein [Rubinisphaera margarita]MCG6156084.1 PQQ-binding-like beta-propeller repeat protein [Rubinisphaera margarita]
MSSHCRLSLSACLLILLAGCGKRTPVETVSPETSGVEFAERSLAHLDGEWPGWRGLDHNGVAVNCSVPTSWGEDQAIRWRVPVPGRGHSSPTVVEDRIYLATATDQPDQQSILAYDRESGEQLWKTIISEGGFPPAGQMHSKSTHANGTVACDGERVFGAFLHHDKVLAYGLDAATGDLDWTQELGAFNSKFGYAPSPVLYHSLVIFAADNQGGGYLAALDHETGGIAWRIERAAVSSYSSPTVASVGGRDQLLIPGTGYVTSYDPRSGEQLWQTLGTAEATCGTVVTSADAIFASGGFPQKQTVAFSPAGQLLWSSRTSLYEPSLIALDGYLYGVTDNGIACCWNQTDGQELWKERLQGGFSASPVACGDHILVSNLQGDTYVFKADPSSYQEVAVNKLGTDCYASPAIVGNQLFLRVGIGSGNARREELICIEVPSPSPTEADAPISQVIP